MASAELGWHKFEEGEFEIHVLPHYAHKNVGQGHDENEPYAFTGRVQRQGSDGRYAGTFIPFKSAADVEFRSVEDALDAGLHLGREIVAGNVKEKSIDELK